MKISGTFSLLTGPVAAVLVPLLEEKDWLVEVAARPYVLFPNLARSKLDDDEVPFVLAPMLTVVLSPNLAILSRTLPPPPRPAARGITAARAGVDVGAVELRAAALSANAAILSRTLPPSQA